ncbi:hypothetical protein BJ944DRAFT_285225 [Cunninghamella echinulata]|nr:hypothetical protein BJ944DRAFT_285225 [Cunninghamella echinulata]
MAYNESISQFYLNLYITTVDYNRKDPVFWIKATTNITKYKHKQRRFPRYYSELQKLERHLASTLDDVLLPVLPSCPHPHFDKNNALVARQWWLDISVVSDTHEQKGKNNNLNHLDSARPATSSSYQPFGKSYVDEDYSYKDRTDIHNHDHFISNDHSMDSQIENMDHENLWDKQIQLWLNRITTHERIILNEGLREFVESEVGFRPKLKPVKRHKKISGFNVVDQVDMNPEFNHNVEQLEFFSQQLMNFQEKIQELALKQNSYSNVWLGLASSWISYGGLERSPMLFIVYKHMTKNLQQLSNIERSQELILNETLSEETHYQIRNVESAKSSMQRRLNAYTDYVSSRKFTESCVRHVDRLKSSSVIDKDKANSVIEDLEQARLEEQKRFQSFQRIDENLSNELDYGYKRNTSKDMVNIIKDYVKGQLHLERQKLEIWKSMQKLLE